MTGTGPVSGERTTAVISAAGQGLRKRNKKKDDRWAAPTTHDQFAERLRDVLPHGDDAEYCANVGDQCWALMDRVWQRRVNAAKARSQWNWLRYAGAVIPVVAAGAGGSLVGHLHGLAGTVIGLVALVGGLAGAAVNAVRPALEYGVDVRKAAQFERLYWDVFNYAMAELPTIGSDEAPARVSEKLEEFARRMEEIALTSAGSTVTSS